MTSPKKIFLTTALPFAMIALATFFSACDSDDRVGRQGTELSRSPSNDAVRSKSYTDSSDILKSPYEDEVLLLVDEYPVTQSELQNFSRYGIPDEMGEHYHEGKEGQKDLFQLVPPFVRYFTLVKEGVARAIPEEEWFKQQMRVKELSLLTDDYKNHLAQNALLDDDYILKKLPPAWLKMNFRLRIFTDPEAADEAYDKTQQGLPFEELGDTMALKGRGEDIQFPETGFIFLESGFFDQFDDSYLFTLQEGEVSRPVITGLGTAIVKVAGRHEMDDIEKNTYLTKVREELTNSYVKAEIRRTLADADVKIHSDALAASFYLEVDRNTFAETIVAEVNGLPITYRIFRMMQGVPVKYFRTRIPRENWAKSIVFYLREFVDNLVLGIEAERLGLSSASEMRLDLHEFAWRSLFQEVQAQLAKEIEVSVGQDEIREHYEKNQARWQVSDSATFKYYFTPDGSVTQELLQNHRDGIDFEDLATGKLQEKKSGHDSIMALQIKERTVYRDPSRLPQLEILFTGLKIGDVHALEGPYGYYIIQLMEKLPARTLALGEVEEMINLEIDARKRKEALEAVVSGMTEKVTVSYPNEGERDKGKPASGFSETG